MVRSDLAGSIRRTHAALPCSTTPQARGHSATAIKRLLKQPSANLGPWDLASLRAAEAADVASCTDRTAELARSVRFERGLTARLATWWRGSRATPAALHPLPYLSHRPRPARASQEYLRARGVECVPQQQLVREQQAQYGRAIATPDILLRSAKAGGPGPTCRINGERVAWLDAKDCYGNGGARVGSEAAPP